MFSEADYPLLFIAVKYLLNKCLYFMKVYFELEVHIKCVDIFNIMLEYHAMNN